ncbi:hypothetical protein HJC23_013203 [Cyclotella cryptica]|uniref:Uncharacterized protein n=1 Tax=Cyclotella cryptica TaxID=29204 RepID=A0ABD3QCS4_9STRA
MKFHLNTAILAASTFLISNTIVQSSLVSTLESFFHIYFIAYLICKIVTATQPCFGSNGDELKTAITNYVSQNCMTNPSCSVISTWGPVNDWYTSQVTDMSRLFQSNCVFNENISSWNTSSVTAMNSMFYASVFNQDISQWDTSRVTDMQYMFWAAAFNQDLSKWDTSRVKSMGVMFHEAAAFNQDISKWDTSSVTNMSFMFSYATVFNQDLSAWETSRVRYMTYMFYNCAAFNQDISKWNTSAVESMSCMFCNVALFNQDLSKWDTSSVEYMDCMFSNVNTFNQDLSGWDTSRVRYMSDMFSGAATFNQDLSKWDTSAVKNMAGIFAGAVSFNQDLSKWDTSSVSQMLALFYGATAFNQPIFQWNTSSVTDMSYMFYQAIAFNQDLSMWDTSSVKSMDLIFYGALSFNQDLSKWDTSSVSRMIALFYGAMAFNQPISQWNTSSVTDMSYMFYQATAFNQDLSMWDTSSVESMDLMFYGALSFNKDLSDWKYCFPYGAATDIFVSSGCTYQTTPASLLDYFCSKTTAAPSTFPSRPSPSPSPSKSPTSSSSNLFYPDQTQHVYNTGCLNDGRQPSWMEVNPTYWLFSTRDKCCKQHFSWNYNFCMGADGTDSYALWYPDWEGTNKGCLHDSYAPSYMTQNPSHYLFDSRQDCCKKHYSWNYAECVGGEAADSGEKWYVDWTLGDNTCKNDGKAPDYMTQQSSIWLFDKQEDCLSSSFYSYDMTPCMGTEASGKFFPDWSPGNEGCLVDERNARAPKYKLQSKMWLYDTLDQCCTAHFSYKLSDCKGESVVERTSGMLTGPP